MAPFSAIANGWQLSTGWASLTAVKYCLFNSGVLDIEVAMGGSWAGSSIMVAISSLGCFQPRVQILKRVFDRDKDVGLKPLHCRWPDRYQFVFRLPKEHCRLGYPYTLSVELDGTPLRQTLFAGYPPV